jgi:hypothetical protein
MHAQRQDHEEHLERISARLHELADEQKWCDTFDDEMEKFGLARREREVELQMSAQVTTTVTTTGSDEDAIASATSYVDHDAVAEALRRGDWEHGGAVEAEVM